MGSFRYLLLFLLNYLIGKKCFVVLDGWRLVIFLDFVLLVFKEEFFLFFVF